MTVRRVWKSKLSTLEKIPLFQVQVVSEMPVREQFIAQHR